jgi:hypothetical protein
MGILKAFSATKKVVGAVYDVGKSAYKETNRLIEETAREQAFKNGTSIEDEKRKIKKGVALGGLALIGGGLFF